MKHSAWSKHLTCAELLIFIVVFSCSVFFSEIAYQTSNYTARLFLTQAVVDHGTFRLDEYRDTLGVDGAVYDGHLYSNKPPGSSLVMLPQYLLVGKPAGWLLNRLDLAIETLNQKYDPVAVFVGWLVQILSLGVYAAVGFVALYRILGLIGAGRHRFLLSLLAYFGTLMFPYATIGMGEMYTVPPVLLGLYFLLTGYFNPNPAHSGRNYWLAGFWYGLAFFITNQVALLFVVAALSLFRIERRWKPVLQFSIPMLVFLLLTLLYNWVNFDSPLNFPIAYWEQGQAEVVLFEWPTFGKLVEMLFLPWKGIFFYSPFLLLSIPGYWSYFQANRDRRGRATLLLLIGSFLVYFVFLYFNVGWFGGAELGFRYIVPVLPFLAIGASYWLAQRPPRIPELVLIGLSMAICVFGGLTDPEVPTGIRNPLVDYNWPIFRQYATNNVPNLLLEQLFQSQIWLVRFLTSAVFLALVAGLVWRFRHHWQEDG